jgi:hypothetical protein
LVCRKCFDLHFNQAGEGAAEIWPLTAAAIDDDSDPGDGSAVGADNVDRFLDAPAARNHVFGDHEPLVRPNREAATQNQAAGFFLHEDVPFPKGAADFLANDDSAEGGRDYSVTFQIAKFVRQSPAHLGSNVGMLKQQGALEKLAAMQTRTKDEVAVEQCAGFAKKREQILAH